MFVFVPQLNKPINVLRAEMEAENCVVVPLLVANRQEQDGAA